MDRFIKAIPYIFVVLLFSFLFIIVHDKYFSSNSKKLYSYKNDVYFNCEEMSMVVGESLTINAGVSLDFGDVLIDWESNEPEVAIVNGGVVKAMSIGVATITANFVEFGVSKSCKINVVNKLSEVEELVISETKVSLVEGDNYVLNININKDKVKWESSNNSVITVNDGVVTAVGSGSATITATTIDGSKTDKVQIVVSDKDTIVNVSSVSLNSSNSVIYINETVRLAAVVLPSNATNKKVTWSSNNTSVAIVNDGIITGVGVGKATITVKTDNGKIAKMDIEVKGKKDTTVNVSGISLNYSTLTMYPNETKTIKVTVLPSNATNKNLTWSSSNNNVATIKDGVLIAVGVGKATIAVKTSNGKTAKMDIVVKNENTIVNVSSISLNASSITMYSKETKTLTATVLPTNATNKNVTWTSSNTSVATVKDGIVTAVGVGKATITVTTVDGKKIARCNVDVLKPELTISASSLTLIDEQTKKLTASLSLKSVDQRVTWSSSNTSVATVDSNGIVRGKSLGTATITATSNYDLSISIKCVVTVRAAKFLFVGNSKTYFPGTVDQDNGIPKRFKAIAKNAGYEIVYDSAVVGGKSLTQIIDESRYPDRVKKIKSNYDYVILQQATNASFENRDLYYSAVNTIKGWVEQKNPYVKIYLRKLWVRIQQDKNGNPSSGSTPAEIQTSYDHAQYIVNRLGIGIINDGPLFYDVLENNSSISIMRYQTESKTDYVHQNATGAYLSALCIYSGIYEKDPTKITYKDGLSSGTASVLKAAAKKHCYQIK